MLKRNKIPPLSPKNPLLSNKDSQTQINVHSNHQMHSPNPTFSRLERKRQDSLGKASSLNSKIFRKNVQKAKQKEEQVEKNDNMINSEYYPVIEQTTKKGTNERLSFVGTKPHQKIPSFESAPNLPTQDNQQKRQQQQMSTQLSKQSDYVESAKEVKFGSVIESTQKINMKKRQKVRSPSILKNGSRNILNGSIVAGSKERQRSCSVASGKDRNERQKIINENNTNKAIKQKYKSILNKLQAQSLSGVTTRGNRFSGATYGSPQRQKMPSPYKYKDEIFPPVYSSLFEGKKSRLKVGEEIAWLRISDIFKDRQLTLAKTFKSNIQITKTNKSYAEDYLLGAFNSLLGSPKLLQKIFQDQSVSPYGIYLLKIYQENAWKYIIIDDYIPVIKSKEGIIEPAFTNVNVGKQGPIDIWPFLLQKAYANYYSRYEALQHGNIIDFAQQISGSPSKKIQIKSQGGRKKQKMSEQDSQKALLKIKKELTAGQTIAIGQLCEEKGYVSLVYSIYNQTLYYNDPSDGFKKKQITFQTLKTLCKAVNLITPFKFDVCSTSLIRKGKPTNTQHAEGYFQIQHPSVRILKVQEASQLNITLRQREKRLFHLKEDFGEYIWCRFVILQKQYGNHGFRWINGQYSQGKSITFAHYLQAGQYWLLIEPEWRKNSPNQIMLQLFSQKQHSFERAIYNPQQKILQSGCLDLAQRYGQLNQINKYICSYNFVTQKVGLIIQNIINQRVNGDVTVMRSIRGLKCKVQILPINKQFYEEVEVKQEKLLKLKQEIELDILKGQHFTVVLKLKGGIDKKFFKSFDFGC